MHASPIGGHSGAKATYQRLKRLFHWKGIKADVDAFIKQCSIYQQAKHEHIHTPGLLQPLPIPQGAWQDLSMDFIDGLPNSEGYIVILVIVDSFTKCARFVALKHPYTAYSVARVMLDTVVQFHGFPKSIVSDRDKVFTAALWTELFKFTETKLLMSLA
uniref:Integrase catalytic domain-containing protein n=1 Tax=Arundo donax TaxID=35708 RepID=A0A0A8YLU7_ARUDO